MRRTRVREDYETNTVEDAAHFEHWRAMNDYDPRDDQPSAAELAEEDY